MRTFLDINGQTLAHALWSLSAPFVIQVREDIKPGDDIDRTASIAHHL